MVPVVMDPFAKELVNPEEPDVGMEPRAFHVGRTEATHELHAFGAKTAELIGELGPSAEVVPTRLRDRRRVPAFELDRVAPTRSEDSADSTRKPATLGLDQVADAFVGAPLTRLRAPAACVAKGDELRDGGGCGCRQQLGDAILCERGRLAHVVASGIGAEFASAIAAPLAAGSTTGSASFSASQHAAA